MGKPLYCPLGLGEVCLVCEPGSVVPDPSCEETEGPWYPGYVVGSSGSWVYENSKKMAHGGT